MKFKKFILYLPLLMLLVIAFIAAKPAGISQLTSLWVGDATDTATVTPGDNDVFISGTLEVDGAVQLDGAITISTTDGLSAPTTKGFTLPLLGAYNNGVGFLTTATVPAMKAAAYDGLPALVYADSAGVTSIGWTFMLPYDYSSGLAFRMMVSSDSDVSYDSLAIDWAVYVNDTSGGFSSGSPETIVINTIATPSTSNVILTFTVADAGTIADLNAGDIVTVYFWNGDGRAGAAKTTEIKAAEGRYTSTR